MYAIRSYYGLLQEGAEDHENHDVSREHLDDDAGHAVGGNEQKLHNAFDRQSSMQQQSRHVLGDLV